MSQGPLVSVVMSVYNGAAELPATLSSILNQHGCSFELIVVDDGSTDGTAALLDAWSVRDARLKVFHQENTGLTRALMNGCGQATGSFIARHDCGDISFPGRFATQAAILSAAPAVVMVSCGARFIGPQGEILFEVVSEGARLQAGLDDLHASRLKGPPHHGATMFRRDAYQAAGGYRMPFLVAQDIDLWLRLAELGQCVGQAEVAYVADMAPGSISGRLRAAQVRLCALAVDCAIRRRKGESDQSMLDAFDSTPFAKRVKGVAVRADRARFYYFVGACLRKNDPASARQYFRRALQEQPLHWKAWVRSILG
jgi:glycosyltransferase involved in cell wall biosynthesis